MNDAQKQQARSADQARIWFYAVGLAALAIEIALHASLPGGLLHRDLGLAGVGLVGLECALVWVLVLGLAVARRGLGFFAQVLGLGAVVRAVFARASELLVGALFVVAWGTFFQMGRFPSQQTVAFASESGKLLALHAWHQKPGAFVVAVTAGIFLGPSVAYFARALAERLRAPQQENFVAVGRSSILLAVVLAALGGAGPGRSERALVDPATGVSSKERERYQYEMLTHLGAAGALAMVLPAARAESDMDYVDESIAVERPLQEPPRAYAKRIRPGAYRRLNVVVVLIESLRPDVLTTYGAAESAMPHVDALAQESVVFRTAYSQATHSDAADLCPLTGRGPIHGYYGAGGYPKHANYPRVLVYDLLHELGYFTGLVSSQNESWGGMINYLDTGGLDHILHSETFEGPTYARDPGIQEFLAATGKKSGKIDDRLTVGEAIRFVETRPAATSGEARPFFLYLNLQNSHFPYELPPGEKQHFAAPGARIEGEFHRIPPGQEGVARALHKDALRYVDRQLARFIAHLKETGEWERTVFVLSGDTGQAFMEHGFSGHGQDVYDEVLRVPLFVHAPGLSPRVFERVASHIDVPPTVLGLLELPPHPAFLGLDLFAPEPPEPRSVFVSVRTFRHQEGIVRAGLKLIRDYDKDRVLLYDLEADPRERHDLAEVRRQETRALLGRLNLFVRETERYYTDPQRLRTEYPPRVP